VEFSHKWVNQALAQRGIPSPGLDKIQAYIVGADQQDRLRMYEVVQRMERGTESSEDWDWLLTTLKRAQTVSVPVPKPMEVTVPEPVRQVKKAVNRAGPLIAAEQASTKKDTCTEAKALRPKHHIYGLKAALTVEMDELRTMGNGGGLLQTVILEAATATGHRSYDWSRKIAFQFMRRELPLLACALLGMLEKPLELGNHGQEANKFMVIIDQGDKLFVQVKQGARLIAVPASPSDVHAWIELVMQALATNTPAMGEAMQMAALRRVAAMENKRVEKAIKVAA
jgi:hypothetical protein